MNFSDARIKFNEEYKNKNLISKSLVTVDGKFKYNISIKDVYGNPNEEFYKWQFIYSIINSSLYPRDCIGTEIYFPKGNINSSPIKIDAVIFSSVEWIDYYIKYREDKNQDALQKLRELAICVIEFKRNDKKIDQVFNSQIKASIKEPDSNFVLGIYYDTGRLFLFKKVDGEITRYDNGKNVPYSQRVLEKFQLEITDAYFLVPSFNDLIKIKNKDLRISKKDLKIEDLDIVYTINDQNIKDSLSFVLKSLDSVSLFNEEGYLILIQLIAIKIFDEKRSDQYGTTLNFYIEDEEYKNTNLANEKLQVFINRIKKLFDDAKVYYKNILLENKMDWKNIRHITIAKEVVKQFEKYSFVKSRKSDLYQLVFYNFATRFKKEENAQFLTPLPIIEFIVSMVNPRRNETVCDPCCGIGDFLSISYINANSKLNDRNLYGFDNDYNMTILAQLNMLLNGDGNSIIKYMPDKGSINQKLSIDENIKKLDLLYHSGGNWDNWVDGTELMKFDVVLTNPPFGQGRSLDLNNPRDLELAKLYELHNLYVQENPKAGLDLGIVFLENTIRIIREGGRFAIVLSNSIASNNTWKFAREWLMKKVRLVALVDLPKDVFAETGVNTSIIIGYKPSKEKLEKLIDNNYSVFVREINNVGYTKKTSNRNVVFEKSYLLDDETFETIINTDGESVVNEDFTCTINDFREWCLFQEDELKKIFLE